MSAGSEPAGRATPGDGHEGGGGSAANGPGHGDAGRAGGSSVPFVTRLRTRGETLVLGAPDAAERWTVRVQVAEVYDAVRVSAPPGEPVLAIKVRALAALLPDADFHEDFVLKLRGAEVLDENASLAESGALDGSIFLLAHRRRRPVR